MSTLRLSHTWALTLASALAVAAVAPGEARAQNHSSAHPTAQTTDSAAVVATVRAFHDALQRGDSAKARTLLAHDLRVAESGGMEDYDEYLSHHLPGDMAYAATVTREAGATHVTLMGDVAWAMSGSHTTGTFRDRDINSVGAELMVLSRDGGQWRIRAIHWSSRPAR